MPRPLPVEHPRKIRIPASAMASAIRDGAQPRVIEVPVRAVVLRFRYEVEEHAGFVCQLPAEWRGRPVLFRPIWSPASGGGRVAWALRAVQLEIGQVDVVDVPRSLASRDFGLESVSLDTGSGIGERIGPESAPFDVPAEGQGTVLFNMFRKTRIFGGLPDEAYLLGVELTPVNA